MKSVLLSLMLLQGWELKVSTRTTCWLLRRAVGAVRPRSSRWGLERFVTESTQLSGRLKKQPTSPDKKLISPTIGATTNSILWVRK